MTIPENKPILYVDTETFSTVDIKTAGTVKYAQDAELLLAGFRLGDEYDYYDYEYKPGFPKWALGHIKHGGLVCAHNALFDYVVLKKSIPELKIEQMIDSMAIVASRGLPLSLEKAGAALDVGVQKYSGGGRLVRKFCIPRKPTKLNKSTRVLPKDSPEEWKEFRDVYLQADVDSMKEIVDFLGVLPDQEQQYWVDTQIINLSGIPIDTYTANLINEGIDKLVDDESSKFIRLTGLFPTQRDKVLGWARSRGSKILNLQAATVQEAIENPKTPKIVKEALEIRANTGHMSFKKYPVMLQATCDDDRIKGTLMYHVATTGRFGGRLLQPQNLTKGNIDGVEAVERIHNGEFSVELVKSAVRPMIYHPQGFTIVDYSQIEARIVQWVAGDMDALSIFTSDKDPYIVMAGKIYGIEYDKVTDKQRFNGKQAILGLGYQMGLKKFIMLIESYGGSITNEEAKVAIAVYRETHKKVVRLWGNMNEASVMAIQRPGKVIKVNKHISFVFEDLFLYMILPSGRRISYFKPNLEIGNYGYSVSYMSMNANHQYVRTATYGGKLVENAVQAIARDILCYAVNNLLDKGYTITTHIHDEIVVQGTYDVEEISKIMCDLPEWAEGLPIEAEGFNSPRFKKG